MTQKDLAVVGGFGATSHTRKILKLPANLHTMAGNRAFLDEMFLTVSSAAIPRATFGGPVTRATKPEGPGPYACLQDPTNNQFKEYLEVGSAAVCLKM